MWNSWVRMGRGLLVHEVVFGLAEVSGSRSTFEGSQTLRLRMKTPRISSSAYWKLNSSDRYDHEERNVFVLRIGQNMPSFLELSPHFCPKTSVSTTSLTVTACPPSPFSRILYPSIQRENECDRTETPADAPAIFVTATARRPPLCYTNGTWDDNGRGHAEEEEGNNHE